MAITLAQGDPVQSVAFSGSTTGTLAYSGAVISGNTLATSISGDVADTLNSVSDSVNAGNWTKAIEILGTSSANVRIYYKTSTAAGTPTVTATFAATIVNGDQITLYEIHGSVAHPTLDQTNKADGASGGPSNPGNLNTTLANSILIAATENVTAESTAGTSFTFLNSANGLGFAGAQYRIVTSTSNYSTAFGNVSSGNWDAVAANFGEAGAVTVIPDRMIVPEQYTNVVVPINR